MIIKLSVLILSVFSIYSTSAFELIAHRGVHQTYHRKNLTNETCTAKRIDRPTHSYIENTIDSIKKAFELGATMVELDVHPTKEKQVIEETLVVFHDWTLDCRTNASCDSGCNCTESNMCVTANQSMAYLKTLDLGHGYTSDQGRSFPLRGKGVGRIPSLDEVLELLKENKECKILVNVKGHIKRTTSAFLKIMNKYPIGVRNRVLYPHFYGEKEDFIKLGIPDLINQNDKKCLFSYVKVGWYGKFPKDCHNKKIFIPVRESLEKLIGRVGRGIKVTSLLWGWPGRFIELAKKNGTEVYASQVDSIEEFNFYKKFELNGIMTNKIEVLSKEIH